MVCAGPIAKSDRGNTPNTTQPTNDVSVSYIPDVLVCYFCVCCVMLSDLLLLSVLREAPSHIAAFGTVTVAP